MAEKPFTDSDSDDNKSAERPTTDEQDGERLAGGSQDAGDDASRPSSKVGVGFEFGAYGAAIASMALALGFLTLASSLGVHMTDTALRASFPTVSVSLSVTEFKLSFGSMLFQWCALLMFLLIASTVRVFARVRDMGRPLWVQLLEILIIVSMALNASYILAVFILVIVVTKDLQIFEGFIG